MKDTATLVGGNVWTQVIGMLSYLLLARLFTPHQFGVYNIFYSYIEVLIILGTCKYEMAAVRADSDREAVAVSRFALRLNAVVSVVLLMVIALLVVFDALPGKSNALGLLALLVPIMVFFCGTTRVYAGLFNRYKQFRPIAVSEMVTATSGALLKIVFGLLQGLSEVGGKVFGVLGLPLGTVLGKMAGNINYLVRLRKLQLPRDIPRSEQRAAAVKHRNFPLYTMPKDWINSFSYNLPLLWFALYFDKAEVGLFAMSLTLCLRPVNILNSAFERVFYVRVMERVREGKAVWSDMWRLVGGLCAVALPAMVLLFFFAEPLCVFAFGSKWMGCGFYVRCLLPWVFVALSTGSVSFLANVFNKQRAEFLFFLVLLVLRVATLFCGIHCRSFQRGILLFSLVSAAVFLALLLWYLALMLRYESGRAAD